MTKRVKKGYEQRLAGQVRAHEHGGRLRISQGHEPEETGSWVSLPVEACEALGITEALEDVPEPWERVREAWIQAWRDAYGTSAPFTAVGSEHATVWARMAEILGIKPEGE